MSRTRSVLVPAFLFAFATTGARGQDEVWRVSGSSSDFGSDVAVVGDLNGDGVRDVVVGQPDQLFSFKSGSVFGLDGRTGAQIFQLTDKSPYFGEQVATFGDDANGDGVEDFLASARKGTFVDLYSGADRSVLLSVNVGVGDLATAPDLDGDGLRDLVVGNVNVFSSGTGALLRSFSGTGLFGEHFAVLDDVDLDGWPDIVITDLDAYGGKGAAYVYSLHDGTLLKELKGVANGEHFGAATVSLRDLDGDGASDFAVGAAPFASGQPKGHVSIYSGLTFSEIARIDTPPEVETIYLGQDGAGDVDGDGSEDFFVGYESFDDAHRVGPPLWVTSGRTFRPLVNAENTRWRDEGSPTLFGRAAGDADGDGFAEILVTDTHGIVNLSRGAPCFLSSWHNRIVIGEYDRDRLPGAPPPAVSQRDGPFDAIAVLEAAGFAPVSAITIVLISDNGRDLFQPVFTATTDADGRWSAPYLKAPLGYHDVVLQAYGLDGSGNVLVSPVEAIQYR